eukprot:353872-Chlamydomonas_euryale.AAC.4
MVFIGRRGGRSKRIRRGQMLQPVEAELWHTAPRQARASICYPTRSLLRSPDRVATRQARCAGTPRQPAALPDVSQTFTPTCTRMFHT